MRQHYSLVSEDEKLDLETTDRSSSSSEGLLGDPPHQRHSNKRIIALHTFLLVINLTVVVTFLAISKSLIGASTYSRYEFEPLKNIVKSRPEYWSLTLGDRSIYTQEPSDEVDTAWDRISAPPGKVGFVMATSEQMKQMNVTSVEAKDGSGSLVTLDVFHQLHCLDFLRRTIYNATYYHMDPSIHTLQSEHVAHCIDSLRLSLQCHADTSVIPFAWIPDYALPWPDFRSTHQCRNFEDILTFAQEHMFDAESHKDLFVHPVLGEYKGGFTGDPTHVGKEGSGSADGGLVGS